MVPQRWKTRRASAGNLRAFWVYVCALMSRAERLQPNFWMYVYPFLGLLTGLMFYWWFQHEFLQKACALPGLAPLLRFRSKQTSWSLNVPDSACITARPLTCNIMMLTSHLTHFLLVPSFPHTATSVVFPSDWCLLLAFLLSDRFRDVLYPHPPLFIQYCRSTLSLRPCTLPDWLRRFATLPARLCTWWVSQVVLTCLF